MSNPDFDVDSAAEHGALTVIAHLRKKALHQGNRPAYTFLVDGEAEKVDLTYAELDRRTRAIGAQLQLAGASGERVLLLYPHGLEFIAAFLGCLYAGAIAVPAYPPRLNRSHLRLQKIIEDAQASVALTTNAVLGRAGRAFREAPYAKNLRWLVTDDMIGNPEEKWREPAIDGDTLAMIQYTSGSTSAPKGVMVSHRNLISNQRMIQEAFRQTESSIIVGWLPLYHDMGLIGNVLQPLFLGASCILMSPTAFLQKPYRWLRAISVHRATTSGGPNFAYDLCVRKIGPEERARLDLSSWTTAFNGAEPVFHETMERFAAAFGICGFRREAFYPCYGLAEATLLVSAGQNKAQSEIGKKMTERDHSISPGDDNGKRIIVSCGRVLPSERVIIVAPESLTQCPDEKGGEIWVSGPNVARGYWNRDHETAQTFGAYLEASGAGPFLRTGDLGYLKDGELFVTGRIKDLIIIRGRNHYPQDIELTVQQSDPVLESGACVAFAIAHAAEERLVIVKEVGRNIGDPAHLFERIREAVAREHDIQVYAIVLVGKGGVPKTTSGKIQRYECRSQYQAGSLTAIVEWRENLTPEVEPVSSPTANRLLSVDAIATESIRSSLQSFLAARLGRRISEIDVNKSLLNHGVDSLTAIELSHHLESRFGVVLPPVNLLEDASIAHLAGQALWLLKEESHDSRPSIASSPGGATEHPLSYGQRSLWFLCQLAPSSGAYNVSAAVRIRSALDTGVLRRALQKIVDRHSSLRTTFLSREGEPFQRVQEKMEVSLIETAASSWSEEFLDDYLAEEAYRPFNLEQGPLLRVTLFKRSPQDHILLVVVHHIVIDLWSLGVLIHELGLFYRAELDSVTAPLDPLPVQYIDYVYWQKGLLAGQEGERLWSYWQGRLAGDLGLLELPTDRPRPSFQTFRGDSQPIYLGAGLTQALRSLGQKRGATLYVILQSIFHLLLHRYTAQEDILIGSPMAGRIAGELAGVIGYFVNLVVLRTDLSSNPTFGALLERVRETTLAAFAHQDYPFALLVEHLQPAHDPSRSPLFQVEFALQKAPSLSEEARASQALIEGAQMNFGGLSAESVVLRRRISRFDLSLFVVEAEDELKGFIEYNADLFDGWRIRRMEEHFRRLAEAVIANPEGRIYEFELMSVEEKERLIVEFNRTERVYDKEQCVHELIEIQVKCAPEAIALIHRDQQLTYAGLNAKANQLAHYLRGLGVGPEAVVGLCLKRSVEMVVALLGVLKAGGAYLPLDPESPLERSAFMLEEAGVGVTVTERKLEERLPAFFGQAVCLDEEWVRISEESDSEPESGVGLENLAYVIYTSGSTGRPKGVMINHGGLVNYLKWASESYRIEEGEGAPVNSSIGFDLTVTSLYGPLINGKRVNLLSEEEGIEALARDLSREGGYSLVKITPAHLEVVAQQLGNAEVEGRARVLVIGGEELRTRGLKYWQERASGTRLINEYGPTETVVGCCVYEVNGAEIGRDAVPIGRPIANTQIYVLDRGLEPAPVGVKGDIYIAGAGLARGYVRSPELTGERFIPSLFGQGRGERLYRTGDVGRHLIDGNIEYVGRTDNQVKVRGYRIEPGEIQSVLEEHRSVNQSVVIVNGDERGGERLIGYVVGETGTTSAELRRHVRERLPGYMVPEVIMVLEEMPLTENGKVDRKRLLLLKDASRQVERESVGARTPFEEIVIGIFEDVLKLDRVVRSDNFFEIGGHSLLATQVASRIRDAFGVGIEVRNIFEAPTVVELASRIEEAMRSGVKDETPLLVKAERRGQAGGQKDVRAPLSFAQQRLWFLDQLVPNNPFYNISGAVRLEGRLNLEALERTINEIVRRHEALRTRFEIEAGEPAQVVDEWKHRRLEVADLTGLTGEEREEEIRRLTNEEARKGFDLKQGPLLRVKVLKLEEEEHVMLLTMHHIVSDGWSMGILSREVGALYRAYSAEEESPLTELPIQYRDFAVWQREWLKGEVLERELEYWRKQLSGMEALGLPTDHRRPAVQSYRGGSRTFVLENEVGDKLRELSRREGVTLFMTMLGGFDVLMSRYSGQEDVVVGTDIANRNRAEIEGLIGFFVNQLVLRVEMRARESFRELMKRVREVCFEAYAHQDLPFEKLVEELQPERELSRSPLFQVKLTLHNAPRAELELEGLRVLSMGGGEAEAAKFDLTVAMTEDGNNLAGAVEYSRELFEEETIERLMNQYANVLRGIVEESERAICEVSLLSEAEREQIVVRWNETGMPYRSEHCIHELFAEQAELTPERMALIGEGRGVSYGELNRRANQLGSYLQGLGVGPEVVVGLYLERSVDAVVALLGVLKAGGAYLPLDPVYPLERVSYMLEEAGVGVVLTVRGLEERLPAFGGQIVCLDMEWARISEESESDPESEVVNENLAYVIYTSGSTGRPKGVMVRHRGLCNLVAVQKDRLGLGAQSHVLQFAPLSFDASVWETFSTLSAGGVLHIHGQENLMPGGALERVLREDQITTVTLPPTVLMVLEEEQSFDLQTVIAAGEACTAEIVKRWARGKRLLDAYGPTEATVCASIGECEERSDGNPTIGRPIANTRLYILDREMEPVPVGVIGELYIAGVGVARGYMGRAELTAERFIPNSLVDEVGGRLYQTGDVARYVLDGEIEFIGRADAQVKLRGYRVELGEIEAVLNEHLSVRQGVVVASEDGRGGKLLIGYVVGGEGADATALKSHLREKLPQYMAPEAIILLEEMPLTANGKIDRKRLASQKDWGRQPEQEYVDSRTPVEEIVVGIFKDVLEINRVGIEDNFFEIGGHSLLATQVISRVRNTFGVEIGVKSIFEWATVEGVASKIEEAVKAGEKQEAPPLVKVKREGRGGVRLPLSFAQQRLWFLDQLVPNDPFYNIPGAVRLEGRLDLGVLELVINEIVARHEVLRTRIEVEDGTPVQVIDAWESRRLERVEMRGLTREEREEEVKRMAREEAVRGFDLSRGPLLRVKVLELEEEEHVVLFTMHHIVSDAWSMGVLVREICALYEAMREGKGSPLEELEIQYADYAVWQREYVRGAVLEREVAYWKEQLKDAAVMELPIDHMRPAAPSYRGGQESVRLGKEASESLRRLSQREGATLFMTLMAAFKVLLMRYSGEDDVVVGTVIANRTRREVEGLIGFFVNTLVMRTDLGGNPSFKELIRREREVALGAYGHQEAPFEKLVEGINPERDLSRNALFQVMMALENTRREMFGINELKVSEVGQETVVAIFDLTLELEERGDEIAGSLEYSCDLYEEETIRRMARHYEKVVEKVIRDAEQRIGEIDLLSASERRQIVEEWNRTARDYPRERCLHELFEEQVERTPDQIAVIFEEQCLSYRELDRRANQLANYLRGKGVRAGALVGLCVERSIEMVMVLLGVLKAGGAYVPLDPEYPAQRLSWMLEDAEVKLLLTEKRVREKREAVKSWSGGEVVGLDSEWEAIGRENEQKVDAGVVSENLAYVIYTSGSTGRPKGAQITHRGVVNFTLGMKEQLGLGEGDRILQVASLSFDVAAEEIYPALSSGATVILARREELNEPRGLQRVLRKNGVSGMELPAAYWHEWVKELSWDGGGVPGTLRFVIVGCELPQKEKITEWKEYGVELLTVFGLTETTITNMVRWVEGEKAKGEGWSEFSIGRPIVNNQIYILNSEQMAAPVGVRGEIYIGGEGVGQGYQKRADLTAERFVPNPFERERGERLYRTGDLGRYGEDGEIEFLGRVDQQVKVRGHRIELGEIESVILEQEGVENAVAVVREVEQGDKRLVAYVVPSEGQSLTVRELREHLERRLPQYLTPSGYVMLERLPLTPNGKIDRQALPAPGKHDAELDDRYVAPSTPIENDVAQIFRDVLRIEDIGIYDDFFALGGHSLLVTQVISRINRAFQVELSVRALFDAPTVNGLVVAIVESQAGQFEDDALSQMLVDLEELSEGELDTEARDGIHTRRAI